MNCEELLEMQSEEARRRREERRERFDSFIPLLVIIGIFGSVFGIVALMLHIPNNRHSPLDWCIWEIHKHEDFDCEFSYVYQALEPKSEIRKEADSGCDLYAYYVKVFTDDRIGEWYCFVEFKDLTLGDRLLNGYRAEQVYLIDCDIITEILYDEIE